MKRKTFVWACLWLLVLSFSAMASSLEVVLEKLQEKSASLHTLKAYFTQDTLVVTGLIRKKHMEGVMYLKRPQMMRWDYLAPQRYHVISDGKKIWFYDEDQNQVMIGKLDKFFDKQLLCSLFLDIKNITKFFEINLKEEKEIFSLELIPTQAHIGAKQILVKVRKSDYQIIEIKFTDFYGNQNTIRLSRFVYNKLFKDSLFRFSSPKNKKVEVIHLP